jgi:AcrR family transcriptional regulator
MVSRVTETKAATTRRRRSDGEVTRQKVLDAAITTILEIGYYQASSNAIARRAGVTWGALQHQFGTREALLLGVLNERWGRLHERMTTTEIHGATLEERLERVLDVLATHYSTPEHLVQLQILLDLTHNPDTSQDAREAVAAHGRALNDAWQPLFVQALGPAARFTSLVAYAFLTLRGYLQSQLIASSIAETASDTRQRELLVRGVAAAIRKEAAERGVVID